MTQPWLANYQNGVPHTVNLEEFASIPEVMAQSVAKYRDRDAFINMGKRITYADLDRLSIQFAT